MIAERPTSSPLSLLAAAGLRALEGRVPGGSAAGPVQATLVAMDREGVRFELRLRVQAGHHIQGPQAASGTALTVEPRDTGVRVAVEWPRAAAHGGDTLSAEIVVPVTLVEPRPAPRPLRLRVRWQCCEDGEEGACHPPRCAFVEA